MKDQEIKEFLNYYGIEFTEDKKENLSNLAEYLGINFDTIY